MPEGEGVGSQGDLGLGTGGQGSQAGSATVDWSKGGVEHFGSFKESLGDLGRDKSLESIKDFHGLAKTHVEAQKMIGRGIFLPKENATQEDRERIGKDINDKLIKAGFREAIPDSPDKYEIKLPEKYFGEPFKPNQPLIDSFKELAHKEQISPSIVQKVVDWYLVNQEKVAVNNDTIFQELKRNLHKEWGGLATYNMESAKRAAFRYIGDDSEEFLTDPRIPPDYSMRMLKAFAEIGRGIMEDQIVTGNLTGMPTADDIWKKMVDMQSQPAADLSHAGHKIWEQEYSKLNKMLSDLQKIKK